MSAISSATFSGVAMIPIATLYFSQVSLISDKGLTAKLPICLFNLFESESKRDARPRHVGLGSRLRTHVP